MAHPLGEGGKTFTIALEGNIGSGKSTLLEALRTNKLVTVLPEPIQRWQDVNGVNLLKLMVEEPKRWANVFQTYVVVTLLENHSLKVETPIKIIERSIYSAEHCFMKLLYENALVHPVEMAIFKEWVTFVKEKSLARVDMGIYVQTSPDVAFHRTRARGRQEEDTISLEYLSQLHVKHEEWLGSSAWEDSFKSLQVIKGDCDQESIMKQYNSIEKEIVQRL